MTRDDIIRLAREAGWDDHHCQFDTRIERFAALVAAAEREKVVRWMMERGYSTGHGDTTEDLLQELDWQIAENWNRALINGITTERKRFAEECIDLVALYGGPIDLEAAIRARGEMK